MVIERSVGSYGNNGLVNMCARSFLNVYRMNVSFFILCFSAFFLSAFAPLEASDPLKGNAGEEVTSSSVRKVPAVFRWSTLLEDAKKRSQASGLPILALFTGPDWCGPCIQLENEVLNTVDFQGYVKRQYIPLKIALYQNAYQSPQERQQYQTLSRYYGMRGVPRFAILSAEGELLRKPDLNRRYSGVYDRSQHVIAAIQGAGEEGGGIGFYVKGILLFVGAVALIQFLKR